MTRLPHGLAEIAYATPLWHGVDFRHLTLGTPSLGWSAMHAGYLLLWAAAGVWIARRSYTKGLAQLTALALTQTRGHLLFERNLMVYRRAWMTILSGFFEPIFYLFSLGIGLGHFVGQIHGVSYASYIAPALLASAAMNGAIYDATTNVSLEAALREGVRLDARDAARPHRRRGRRDGMGAVSRRALRHGVRRDRRRARPPDSWWAILASRRDRRRLRLRRHGIAASTFLRTWQDFELVQIVLVPMFLFSATFFPISVYPVAIQWFVRFSPLYHAITLIRALTLRRVGPINLLNAAYLLVLGVIGIASPGAVWPGCC